MMKKLWADLTTEWRGFGREEMHHEEAVPERVAGRHSPVSMDHVEDDSLYWRTNRFFREKDPAVIPISGKKRVFLRRIRMYCKGLETLEPFRFEISRYGAWEASESLYVKLNYSAWNSSTSQFVKLNRFMGKKEWRFSAKRFDSSKPLGESERVAIILIDKNRIGGTIIPLW